MHDDLSEEDLWDAELCSAALMSLTGIPVCSPLVPTSGSGSDAASILTSAKREGDHYILNGSKVRACVPKAARG